MNRLLKWILMAAGAIVVVLIAAVVLIPLLVDVNEYKPQIEAQVEKATGRPLKIGGDMALSVFPWIGVALSDLQLGSPAEFGDQAFLAVGRFEAQVRLLPLLSREVEVKRIVVEAPALALIKTKSGKTNWDFATAGESPGKPEEKTPPPGADTTLATLTAEEIAIRNGRLTYVDEASGQKQEIADLNLVLKDVSLDRPLQIDFTTRFNGQPITLSGNIGPVGNPPASQPLGFDLALAAMNELALTLKGSARDIQTQPVVNLQVKAQPFSPRKLFERLGQPFPVNTTDPKALQSVAFSASLNGGPQSIKLDAGQMTLDQSRIDFEAEAGEFDKPRINVKAKIDDIDVDRYLPAEAPEKKPAKKKDQAPAPAPPAGEDQPGGVDYAPLRRLVLDARLDVAKLKINQARLQQIVLQIKGRNGRFDLEPFSADLYGGKARIEGNLDVTRSQPRSNISLQLTDMLVGPFMTDVLQKDFLEGKLVTAIDLQFAGDRPETIRKSLNGKGRLTFNDGAIVGIDLAGMVRNLQAAFGAGERPTEKPRTDFSELDIPFELKDGVFQTAASNMKSPLLRLLANGQADLVNETLNFRVNPKFVATLVGQGDTASRSGIMVPVLVSGSFDQPTFRPDLKSLARQQVEEKIVESDQFKKVFKENEELQPYEDKAKKMIKGLFD
ncbi:MAG: AsmA family protein [Desulfobacterales bacterium]|nr:AsmA family protein [Desulfobacterales bacterium]